MGSLELDNALLKICIFSLQFADGFLELLSAGEVDFSRRFGVVGGLRVGEEGLLGSQLVQPILDILRSRGLVVGRPAKLLQNFISALLRHLY